MPPSKLVPEGLMIQVEMGRATPDSQKDLCKPDFHRGVTYVDDLKTEYVVKWADIRLPMSVLRDAIPVEPPDRPGEIQFPMSAKLLNNDADPPGVLDVPIVQRETPK
jgi:hypothetical protein